MNFEEKIVLTIIDDCKKLRRMCSLHKTEYILKKINSKPINLNKLLVAIFSPIELGEYVCVDKSCVMDELIIAICLCVEASHCSLASDYGCTPLELFESLEDGILTKYQFSKVKKCLQKPSLKKLVRREYGLS